VFNPRLWRSRVLAGVVALAACTPVAEESESMQGQLRLGGVLGETSEPFARAEAPRAFQFPADHGAHPDYRSEWWYLVVMLTDEAGEEFGVQFTVFRQALAVMEPSANPWRSPQAYMAHAAVTSVGRDAHWEAQRLARGHPGVAGARAEPYEVGVDGWSLTGIGGESGTFATQRLIVGARRFEIDLTLEVVKPPVLQGHQGLSAKGPDQASYYYSVPRLTAAGTLVVDGARHRVSGSAWMDREWSTSVLSEGQQGWDWFAVHLDDHTELMAFRLRRKDGARDKYDHGLMVRRDGSTRLLDPEDFMLDPIQYWVDDSGVRWPVGWKLTVGDKSWRLRAAVDDQRMDTAIVYWEGLIRVFDAQGERVGSGYMELTGYGA